MPVHNDMVTFPRVVRPSMVMYEDWQEFAEHIGAAKHGVDWLTASYLIVIGDHIGTHIDSLRHMRDDAPGPEGIPLEYCYGDGVCLDFRHLPKGRGHHRRRHEGGAGQDQLHAEAARHRADPHRRGRDPGAARPT